MQNSIVNAIVETLVPRAISIVNTLPDAHAEVRQNLTAQYKEMEKEHRALGVVIGLLREKRMRRADLCKLQERWAGGMQALKRSGWVQ
jgi:hypothetical protein